MILRDFECANGHVFEGLTDSSTTRLSCPVCKRQARKIITSKSYGWNKHPAVQDSTPTYLAEAASCVQAKSAVRLGREQPINSRSELNRRLKQQGMTLHPGKG